MSLTQDMHQVATYWPKVGIDKFARPTFGSPTKVFTRWQRKTVLFRDALGRQAVSQTVVYVAGEMQLGGYIAEGDHFTLPVTDPETVGAHEIRDVQSSPDLELRDTLYKVLL